jgi:hypothetical protein
MNLDEAREMAELTGTIAANLERIRDLLEEVPSDSDMEGLSDLQEQAAATYSSLAGINEAFQELPSDGDLDVIQGAAGRLYDTMKGVVDLKEEMPAE